MLIEILKAILIEILKGILKEVLKEMQKEILKRKKIGVDASDRKQNRLDQSTWEIAQLKDDF